MTTLTAVKAKIPLLYYRYTMDVVRVWRPDWAQDQFEQMPVADFQLLKRVFDRFSFRMHEAED